MKPIDRVKDEDLVVKIILSNSIAPKWGWLVDSRRDDSEFEAQVKGKKFLCSLIGNRVSSWYYSVCVLISQYIYSYLI